MTWHLLQIAPSPRRPTPEEVIATFLLLLPFLCSIVYRVYAKIRRRDGRSVGLQILTEACSDHEPKYEYRIVAVHGLGANPEHTWTCKTSSKSNGGKNQECVHLLKDLLMKDRRFADARILHFAYNSDWLVDACFESARDIGLRLVESLVEHRDKHAALSINEDDTEKISEDTHGIIFLGTPHLGSPIAGYGATIAYLTGFLGSDTGLLLSLRSNGELLRKLSEAFQHKLYKKKEDLGRETRIVSICEQKPTYFLNWLYAGKIVPSESATFGTNFMQVFKVDKDHSGLNKCCSPEDPLYRELTTQLQKMQPNVPPKINKLQQAVIDRLTPVVASDAEYHPSFDEDGGGRGQCLPQTRVQLLEDICNWLDDFDSPQKHLYWLQGKAGTGKSTIARTVVSKMAERKRIVASFFFKRGEEDRARLKRFFTTLSAQLVRKLPSLATIVHDALESEPSLPEQDPRVQFKKLVQEPLQKQNLVPHTAIVVVVDALDECDSKEDLTNLVQQLLQPIHRAEGDKASSKQLLVKYLLTSRLDHHTQSDFNKVSEKISDKTELERATSDTTKQDIERYLKTHLENIDGFLDPLPNLGPWSNPADVEILKKLTDRASPLFEFAAAACRFISQTTIPGGPKDLVQDILDSSNYGDLDGVYLPILRRRFGNLKVQWLEKAKTQFQNVIGSVLSLADSVTVPCLARLLGQDEPAVRKELLLFQSVLVVPEKQESLSPISLFHESFRDFLIGPEANEDFKVDTQKIHERLATRCLVLLRGALKENICNLKSPGTDRSQVAEETIQTSIPQEVQYACRFWIYHLAKCGLHPSDESEWHVFLKCHFLHWLEALVLLGRYSEIALLIRELEAIIHPTDGTQLRAFLDDAYRFVLYFGQIINTAPLQIYSSALTFSPEDSVIRKNFNACRPRWIARTPMVEAQWSPCLQTLEGHRGHVTGVAFSSEGLLASGDICGTVKMWDPKLGTCLQTLSIEKITPAGTTVMFSKTGKLACLTGNTLALWDASQGDCLEKFDSLRDGLDLGSRKCPWTLTDDEKLVFAAKGLGGVIKWDPGHGCETIFTAASGESESFMVPSSDGQWVAMQSGREIKICHMDSNDSHSFNTLPPPFDLVVGAVFSRDNRYFAFFSIAGDIKVCDVASATSSQLPQYDDPHYSIRAATFSPDGRLIAAGYRMGTITIWDWKRRTRLAALKGHSDSIKSLAFSPDGVWLASASADGTVKVWDISMQSREGEREGLGSLVSLSVTMDGQRFATAAFDAPACLWSDYGKECTVLPQTLEAIAGIQISRKGNIAAAFTRHDIEIWDLNTCSSLSKYTCPDNVFGQTRDLRSVALSADGGRLVAGWRVDDRRVAGWGGYKDGGISVWETRTGRLLKESPRRTSGWSFPVSISPDGTIVASGDGIEIWVEDLNGDKLIQLALAGVDVEARQLAFSRDGRRLAALCFTPRGFRTFTWDLKTGACLRIVEIHVPHFVLDLSFFKLDFPVTADLVEEELSEKHLIKYHISWDGVWIMRHNEKLLWLPPEYRPENAAASGSSIVVASQRGRSYVIGLSDDGLSETVPGG
ncbi:hypothetical protein CCMA1212_009831 [Trichoderma ghanense]|uniref:NACHT domain-containing protein n=1 Tax=Trichoderma ghanense TaxID=65468 RepID=A0ABY2GRX2_9HYPO